MIDVYTLKVRCGCCDGQGVVFLPTPLRRVLFALNVSGSMTAQELCLDAQSRNREDINLTAMCNRLATLRDMDLVTRQKAEKGRGAWWVWAIKNNSENTNDN